jgi:hypothetical protein
MNGVKCLDWGFYSQGVVFETPWQVICLFSHSIYDEKARLT